eukprot:Trichotokara_eunicae@DN1875_c0_g1_i1.p1
MAKAIGVEKTVKPTVAKTTDGKKGRHTKSRRDLSTYIHRVLKDTHKDLGVSKKTMSILNSFVNDQFERIAAEAGRCCQHGKGKTLGSNDFKAAIQLVLPKELAQHADSEGKKAVQNFQS